MKGSVGRKIMKKFDNSDCIWKSNATCSHPENFSGKCCENKCPFDVHGEYRKIQSRNEPAQNTTISRYSKKHENKVSDYTKEPSSPAARLKEIEYWLDGRSVKWDTVVYRTEKDTIISDLRWFRWRLDYILAVAEEVYPRDWYVRVRELKKLKRELGEKR